ncbi:unnamed protein product [Cylindrotheca closterium]|uniref:WW domain-containing protein n=1 Tax=Cylindrotheca closterium TaxID=2856 RepID=A0AAD2FZ06_9STRA|nr:unnamed protein product [Cylindrotheca closterium]
MLSRLTSTATRRIPRHVGGICSQWASIDTATDTSSTTSTSWTSSSPPFGSSVTFSTAANSGNDQQNEQAVEEQTSLLDKSDKNIFQKLFDRHSISRQTNRILIAESFLEAAITQASDPRWYGPGRIKKEFRSYQAILTMHIWMLHKRLLLDTEDPHSAHLIQEELFDIFWTDSNNRMRAYGVNEMLLAKNLKTVQQYTFMHCFHYDHCYSGELLENPEERLEELKHLVQTHILLLNPPNDENDGSADDDADALDDTSDQAERIAWYIEAQYQNIVHDWPDDWYRKARVAWVDLPDFSDMVDAKGNILEPFPVDPEDILPEDWARNIANDGTYYYWNTKTRKAQWEKPKAN